MQGNLGERVNEPLTMVNAVWGVLPQQVISLLSSVTEEEKLYFTGFQSCKNPLVECLLMWAAVIIVSKQ